jgi:hypothetical protein
LLPRNRNIFSEDEKAVLLVEAELVYPEAPATILASTSTEGSVEVHSDLEKSVYNMVSWDQLLDLGASKLDLQRALLVLHLTTCSSEGAPQGLLAAPPACSKLPSHRKLKQASQCRRWRPDRHLQEALQVRAAAAQHPAR